MVKYLQSVPLDVSINWRYLYLDAGKTWITLIGHNATPCHNFNALQHALPHTLPHIFSHFDTDRA